MDHLIDRRKYWERHFSDQAKRYAVDSAKALDFSNEKLMSQVHDIIIGGIDLEYVRTILDTGTGLGNLVDKIGSASRCLNKDIEVFGIDASFEMVKRAASKVYGTHITASFLSMDLVQLAFKDNTFDCSICSESLQYTDPYMATKELIRVSRHQLVMSVPNSYDSIIRRAIERNMGMYVEIKIDHLLEFLAGLKECAGIHVYPLIFSKDQRIHPYREMTFFKSDELSPVLIDRANRFVLKIKLG